MSRSRQSSIAGSVIQSELADASIGVERLERELECVAAALIPGHEPGDESALRPRPISAAELARRVRPFLGWN